MKFKDIFKDTNDINEKSVVGFFSFIIMILFALADVITGWFGKDLLINDYIFNAFLWVVLGSFGIGSIDKFVANNNNSYKEKPEPEEEE